jgi:hypothetical protein
MLHISLLLVALTKHLGMDANSYASSEKLGGETVCTWGAQMRNGFYYSFFIVGMQSGKNEEPDLPACVSLSLAKMGLPSSSRRVVAPGSSI